MATPSQPTGLTTDAAGNRITIRWIKNPESDIQGYNVYNSTTSGGGLSGYTKLNNELITEYRSIEEVLTNREVTVEIIGGEKVTTIREDVEEVFMFVYDHEDLLDTKVQYYVVTAVNNSEEESLLSIEIHDTPLILSTKLIEFPIRTTSDVTRSMIDLILNRHPDIDVKPGTMTRDLHIDPHAAEFSHLYMYIDFLSRSESFITLLDIDDPDNTGESVAVEDSDYKQALKRAFQFTDDQDLQDVIDIAFDKLANNFNTFRVEPTSSVGQVIFYTTVKPLSTIVIPEGTIVSTTPSSTKDAINFETTNEAKMLIASINDYYNEARQRYEVTADVQSVETGETTNVNVGTIINSTFSQLRVTNIKPAENGFDVESNTSLAHRAMLAFTSLDVGTRDGYLKTAIETQYVEDVLVVDAGHELMQRDFDYVREEHLYGKVDIYFKGSVLVSYSETFGFLYDGGINEDVQIDDVVDMQITVLNPNVSIDFPVYLVQEITNVTKADAYDLTGNYTLYKNAVELQKTEYTVDLTSGEIELNNQLFLGDSLTADYQYKVPVTGEVVLASAAGGEIQVTLDAPLTLGKPIAIFSDQIYLTRVSAFSIDPGTDILTVLPEHVYKTGDVVRITSTDAMPSPLIIDTDYYVIKVSNTQLKLATTPAKAEVGTAIDILTSGVGALTIRPEPNIELVRNVDYTINLVTGQVDFAFASFPTGLLSGDSITADYDYVETIVGEVVVNSASGGETTANLANGNVVESFVIEPNGVTINLNEANVINAAIGMTLTDLIRATYKYRKGNDVILTNQPVESIVSVAASDGTLLTEGVHYQFNKVDDLLLEGNSVKAKRSIRMLYDSESGLPEGTILENEDSISLVALEYEPLTKKGIDTDTIVVTNTTKTVTYSINVDYTLGIPTSPFEFVTIARSVGSTIANGETVLISYSYGEPITVVYNVNSLIEIIQSKVNVKRHLTADVLVKEANRINVDLEFTVKLKVGANGPEVKDQLSTSLYALFNQKKLGSRVSQSDAIRIIDENSGVDYVILPLTRMAISDGTHIAYEAIDTSTPWYVHQIGVATSYRTDPDTLRYKTAGSSSDSSVFWRVSEDDIELTIVDTIAEVADGVGRAYIASDGTLYISTRNNDDPSSHSMTVAYNVSGETGSNDVVVTDLDYFNLESLIIHAIL